MPSIMSMWAAATARDFSCAFDACSVSPYLLYGSSNAN